MVINELRTTNYKRRTTINSLQNILLTTCERYEYVCLANGNNREFPHGSFKTLLAASNIAITLEKGREFISLTDYINNNSDWVFGHFGYDLKNQLEKLQSNNKAIDSFEDSTFFVPELLLEISDNGIKTLKGGEFIESDFTDSISPKIGNIKALSDKTTYLNSVSKLIQHIEEGDIYEANYCMAFEAENSLISPVHTYIQLNSISPTPFSTFYKCKNNYVMGASPERFIKKEGNKLISQPIKGTIKRGKTAEEDSVLKNTLLNSEKDRAENLMIVDLVRNDMSKSSKTGTTTVEELFGIYSFQQVHQMISTVVSELRPDVSAVQAIANAFPMGSMTGAPKIRAMQLIEQYEDFKRGIFSGSIGYVSPETDFDFNVVIRSIFYNADTRKLSYAVGSAITYDSVPEEEYNECMLKAEAILKVLAK